MLSYVPTESLVLQSFTLIAEKDSTLPFLDVAVNREPDDSLWHKVYKTAISTYIPALEIRRRKNVTAFWHSNDRQILNMKCSLHSRH